MKKLLLFCLALFSCGLYSNAQTLTLVDTVQFPFVTNSLGDVGSSDCWGWTDSLGVDYAIIGNKDNIAFVRASDQVVLDMVEGPQLSDGYYHRDMVTWGNYCYVVAEMTGVNQGLMIIDLSYLPDSVHFVKSWTNSGTFIRCHNVDIDEGTGYLYLEGDEFTTGQGVEIVNVNDPENPVHEGTLSLPTVHDMNARNDTLWVAEGSSKKYSVWDVSNKSNPVQLGFVQDNTFGYCHQIWPSDDGRYFITTEETPTKTIKVWDASNMSAIVRKGEYLATNGLAHNAHVMGNYIFISHYTSGVTVVDWSNPDVPVEVASYDTYPTNDISDFYGCWGAFPYTANGYVYASNFEGTLTILNWSEAVATDVPAQIRESVVFPNPVANFTNIRFELDGLQTVSIDVLDLNGKIISNVVNGEMNAGSYVASWHPDGDLANGVYMVRIRSGEAEQVHKIILER